MHKNKSLWLTISLSATILLPAIMPADDELEPQQIANRKKVAAWTQSLKEKSNTDCWVADGIIADRKTQRVTIAAEGTGLERGATVEFVLIEQGSDRSYEALAMALAKRADIAHALEFIGLPPGYPAASRDFRFWPKGERVTIKIAPWAGGEPEAISSWVTNKMTQTVFNPDFIYVGSSERERPALGARGAADVAPGAIATTYNEATTLLDITDQAAQSEVYGNRAANPKLLPRHELVQFILQPSPAPGIERRVLDLQVTAEPAELEKAAGLAGVQLVLKSDSQIINTTTGDVRTVMQQFADASQKGYTPYVVLSFDDRLSITQARELAMALAAVEGPNGIRIDAPPAGQLYYRAFLPQERWRKREERLMQPLELRITREGGKWQRILVEIQEDWSKEEALDPALSVKEHPFETWEELPLKIKAIGEKLNTILIFAPADAPLSAFMPGARAIQATQPMVFVFAE